MIVNQQSLQTMFVAFRAAFNEGFRGVSPQWSQVATLVPSTTRIEEYGWIGQFPKLREWIGDRQVKALSQFGYTIRNKDYESTIAVDRNDINDDRYGIYNPLFQEMGFAAATHPDELVFALLAAGFATACYDGQYFFDSDHPVGSGTVSNTGGGSGAPWFLLDTRRALKPLIYQQRAPYNLVSMQSDQDEAVFMRREFRYGVDGRGNVGFGFWQMAYGSKQTLSMDNYVAARAAMMSYQSDEGRPLGIAPNLLVVGSANEKAAKDCTLAERQASGADNVMRGTAQVLVVPYL
ncbi:MAG: Mu-like prophage major head subunit gpT family protein [Burkholderiales bacterium]|nr:Mu-like prophage major head subunit gpT family protein [Burkholderiales bacterium]